MGGINLLDFFIAKYKLRIRSTWWYLYIFWHTIILGVVSVWLQFKRDCRTLQIPEREVMNWRHFQSQLATSLIQINTLKRWPTVFPLMVFAWIMWGQWKLKKSLLQAMQGWIYINCMHQLWFICASQIKKLRPAVSHIRRPKRGWHLPNSQTTKSKVQYVNMKKS